jgi:hypothetical protein
MDLLLRQQQVHQPADDESAGATGERTINPLADR